MPLNKTTQSFNFAGGLDSFTDPNQLTFGKFVSLNNAVFTKVGGYGRLQKRNGFGHLSTLPDACSKFITTYKNNLLAIGPNFTAYNAGSNMWAKTGPFQALSINTLPLVRNLYNQTQIDTTIAPNGVLCAAYTEARSIGNAFVYSILDSNTGQSLVQGASLPVVGGLQQFATRVFSLNNNFVFLYAGTATTSTLQYVYIPANNPTVVNGPFAIGSGTTLTLFNQQGFDGIVSSQSLYVSWANSPSGPNTVFGTSISSAFSASNVHTLYTTGSTVINLTVTADGTGVNPVIWTAFNLGNFPFFPSVYATAYDPSFNVIRAPDVKVNSSGSSTLFNLASTAQNGLLTVYAETPAAGNLSNFINAITYAQVGSTTAQSTYIRTLGLASKAFIYNGVSYFLGAFNSKSYQDTYFLIGSASQIVSKLAYGNGSSSAILGGALFPSFTVTGSTASVGYLINDFITTVNKLTAASSTTPTAGIYTQTGLNLAKFTFGADLLQTKELGQSLNLNGGFLSSYDGVKPVENNFFISPDFMTVVGSTLGGSMIAQTYYYQSVYEWTDNQGNLFQSAASVPTGVTTTGPTSQTFLTIPLLRLTNRLPSNPVRIGTYRWSTAQPVYFKIGPSTVQDQSLLANDVMIVADTKSDSQIIGNQILYTNGSVVEDINGPPSNAIATWDSRLWMVDAEDQNLLWFSKQVIESTPVEMSQLFTYYVEPNSGAQGPTGPILSISPMDDKLIVFKKAAVFYINGSGPDNTGANSQYSQPIYITATVGCSTPNSIVSTPNGLMFKSDKGIWLLGRDLSTTYIGREVEAYNSASVLSSFAVPGTNQVRFVLDSGLTLMYDYFVGQWGVFTNISGLSACVYNNLHTYVTSLGSVFQETPNVYFDGTTPTVMSFTTGWINLAGLQGYVRAYRMFMLGNYISPHTLSLGLAYNYNPSITQTPLINPTNTTGSGTQVEPWRINFAEQQCQSFQLSLSEVSSQTAGAGLTISGLDIVIGSKRGYPSNVAAKNTTS